MIKTKVVWVYRNLKHGKKARPLYSIVCDGRVVSRQHRVLLRDCTFVVREGGRRRYLREGRKNVHAFVKGTLADSAYGIDSDGPNLPVRIVYRPDAASYFFVPSKITAIGNRVDFARAVLLNENGITAAYLDRGPGGVV